MSRHFEQAEVLRSWAHVETVLARVEADLGLIPRATAESIANTARSDWVDVEAWEREHERVGHPLVAFINVFVRACGEPAERYFHWGATSQDIMDTALVLQLQKAGELMLRDLDRLIDGLSELATKHAATYMATRTNGQYALPGTLGLRFARWAAELARAEERLRCVHRRSHLGQFYGASGTLASLGEHGPAVQRGLAESLGLELPPVNWHASRDAMVELGTATGILAQSIRNVADGLFHMQRSEVAEIHEAHAEGQIGSSTMPHKRNPFATMKISATAQTALSAASDLLRMPAPDGDRDAGNLMFEGEALERCYISTHEALEGLIDLLPRLVVDVHQLERNLETAGSASSSESVMMRLANHVGRHKAHSIVHAAVTDSVAGNRALVDVLMEDARVSEHVDRIDLEHLLSTRNYAGRAEELTHHTIAHLKTGKVS
ncbi:lyase family protein [Paeniglutamicibacter sp. ZC-3]|uniref:lyase family protein n=1 Tax=Paeniglutamicibacter sp. ZC-3 TaxID=2986919 RepID=UPI0021F7897D|nr:lyase family protein [Paeniglutamicibacter sp. ZC-3]MCV9993339.1 lyase family protein [Paeniglutamicibacter sp. ZC-3]